MPENPKKTTMHVRIESMEALWNAPEKQHPAARRRLAWGLLAVWLLYSGGSLLWFWSQDPFLALCVAR
jgi:hypothetical protein